MTHSRNKGNRWERDCIKILKEVWPDHDFARSGTMAERWKSSAQGGDLHCPDIELSVECKSLMASKWSWMKLLQGDYAVMNDWLDQLVRESRDGESLLLMFSITKQGKWFAFNPGTYTLLVEWPVDDITAMSYYHNGMEWIIASMDNLSSFVKPNVKENDK